jgi:hypothetical protein
MMRLLITGPYLSFGKLRHYDMIRGNPKLLEDLLQGEGGGEEKGGTRKKDGLKKVCWILKNTRNTRLELFSF